jgi:hypothetical protein
VSRKPRVQRTPEEKWQIVLEILKSGIKVNACFYVRAIGTDAGN